MLKTSPSQSLLHKTYQSVLEMLPGDEKIVSFQSPIEVKKSPHVHLISIKAAVKTDGEGLSLFDGEHWHEFIPNQTNADLVINSVYQRLRANPVI